MTTLADPLPGKSCLAVLPDRFATIARLVLGQKAER